MICQRPQCIALLLVWLTTFYVMWTIFCKLDTTLFQFGVENSIRRNSRYDETSETTLSKRGLITFINKSLIDHEEKSSNILDLKFQYIDVKKELQKLDRKYSCKPVENVLFIKTHKTGSSTVTNILNRFADLRELLVAIPSAGDYRFQWPNKFHWTFVDLLRLDGETANIFNNHARYNREQMDIVMKKKTKYITILRDPVAQFVSSFYYFEFDKIIGLQRYANPLDEFLKDPDKHLYSLSMRLGDLPETMNLIQNGMMYDLGYDFLEFGNANVVRKAVKKLESELDLVLILEYFDESLVLMMRQFCWDFDDILYIKMNAMKYKKGELTKNTRKKLVKWNSADVTLYKSFNQTFWAKVRKHGTDFWEDVKEFKRRNAEMRKICSPKVVEQKAFRINVTINSLIMGQKVHRFHRSFCAKLMMNEIQYLDYFRYKFGQNYGYQKILAREGATRTKTGELRARLKKMRRNPLRFGKK